MTREIKFRAWDKWKKTMVSPNGGDFIGWHGPSNWRDYLDIMQYTGLNDKNGKEVFEGDILQLHGDPSLRFPVKWEYEAAGWAIECHKAEPEFLGDYLSGYLEVIGNIHQTPELIA